MKLSISSASRARLFISVSSLLTLFLLGFLFFNLTRLEVNEEKDKLMNPFVQAGVNTRIKGTGLGLAICKQLATRTGGHFSFVSELSFPASSTDAVPSFSTEIQQKELG